MEECKTKRIRYVEVAKDIYAAITPADGMDITDAGLMDNFSNSAYANDMTSFRDIVNIVVSHVLYSWVFGFGGKAIIG